jgi:hypothetical protein
VPGVLALVGSNVRSACTCRTYRLLCRCSVEVLVQPWLHRDASDRVVYRLCQSLRLRESPPGLSPVLLRSRPGPLRVDCCRATGDGRGWSPSGPSGLVARSPLWWLRGSSPVPGPVKSAPVSGADHLRLLWPSRSLQAGDSKPFGVPLHLLGGGEPEDKASERCNPRASGGQYRLPA